MTSWDGFTLKDLLVLQNRDQGVWRTICSEGNANGRTFGGQLLGQALAAAAQGVPADRSATVMQFMFLQSADSKLPIDYTVTPLQQGKRFTTQHVRGSQEGRLVCDAHCSFAVAIQAPEHEALLSSVATPEESMRVDSVPPEWRAFIERVVGHSMQGKPALDFRLPDPPPRLLPTLPEPRFRIWMRHNQSLQDHPHIQAAAFAYMSDYWLNFPAIGGHLNALQPGEFMYQASLNHALWLYRPVRADDWLLFDITSPVSAKGRGLVVARIYDRDGHLVANCTQECVMVPRAA